MVHELFCDLSGVQVTPRPSFSLPLLSLPGLFDNFATEAYQLEKTINIASFEAMNEYYRQLRTFRLGGSLHQQTSEEKVKAIEEVSQPLRALDLLVRQMGVAIREPTRPGVGLLTIASELATRMGALRVCVCDSGVFRCGTACSLEQVMTLVRSHQLPLKSLKPALNTMRRKGSFSLLLCKNKADIHMGPHNACCVLKILKNRAACIIIFKSNLMDNESTSRFLKEAELSKIEQL